MVGLSSAGSRSHWYLSQDFELKVELNPIQGKRTINHIKNFIFNPYLPDHNIPRLFEKLTPLSNEYRSPHKSSERMTGSDLIVSNKLTAP
jgi:hypothetical protein